MAVEENQTSLINTVLMFSRTVLLPNKEIFGRLIAKMSTNEAYINSRSIKIIMCPYIK